MHFNKTTCEPIKSLHKIFGDKNFQNISLIKYLRVNYSDLIEKNLNITSSTQINDIVN